jgi:hypothetical protein
MINIRENDRFQSTIDASLNRYVTDTNDLKSRISGCSLYVRSR